MTLWTFLACALAAAVLAPLGLAVGAPLLWLREQSSSGRDST